MWTPPGSCHRCGVWWQSTACDRKVQSCVLRFVPPLTHSPPPFLVIVEKTQIQLSLRLHPQAIACTPSGVLLVTNCAPSGVFAVHPPSGKCIPVAGCKQWGSLKDGVGLEAAFNFPQGIVVVASECCGYVSDTQNHCIRRVTLPAHWCEPPPASQCSPLLC